MINILYPAWLMTKNRSWGVLREYWPDLALASLIGSQLIVGFGLQGLGMALLGPMGAAVGVGVQQAMQIVGSQSVGFVSGEWRGVAGTPRRRMYAAIALLMVAVAILVQARMMG
jgi:hypothetical protein